LPKGTDLFVRFAKGDRFICPIENKSVPFDENKSVPFDARQPYDFPLPHPALPGKCSVHCTSSRIHALVQPEEATLRS
jgi:hypothetical protein